MMRVCNFCVFEHLSNFEELPENGDLTMFRSGYSDGLWDVISVRKAIQLVLQVISCSCLSSLALQ